MRLKYLIPVALFAAGPASAAPIDGTFNYQGRLTSGGAPITGNADVRFSLWDAAAAGAQVGGTINYLSAPVTDGLFNADLDFGVDALNGEERWLQVEVRSPAGAGGYVNLGRQPVLGAPYAIQTRGIYVEPDLDVRIGTTGTGRFFNVDDGDSLVAQIGSSLSDGGGFVYLAKADPQVPTIILDADNDDVDDADAQGALEVRSYNGGPGGLVSVRNDDNSETISLLGGGAGSAGSFNMFDSAGDPILRLDSFSGSGQLSIFDPTNGNPFLTAIEDTSSGGGGILNIARNNLGTIGFEVNGNWSNTESTRVFIGGVSNSMSFDTSSTGNSTVTLPTGAINDAEILDEPGVASTLEGSLSVSLTGGVDTILSRTITCPTSGYCVVIGTCQGQVSHSNGTLSTANFGVSDVAGSLPVNQDVALQYVSGAVSGTYTAPVTVHGTFLASAGSNTFYLLGQEIGGSWTSFDSQLTVMFFPTAYGTVEPTLLTRSGGGDASALPMAPLSAGEIRAEQLQAADFDRARRDAEMAEMRAMMEALRNQVDGLQQRLDERAPHRANPPSRNTPNDGAVLSHNDAQSR